MSKKLETELAKSTIYNNRWKANRPESWATLKEARRKPDCERMRAYYAENKERLRQASADRYAASQVENRRIAQEKRAARTVENLVRRLMVRPRLTPDEIKARKAEQFRSWRERNLEKCRERRRENYAKSREQELAKATEWKAANVGACRALAAKRIAAKKQAIPSWANPENIQAWYDLAALVTEETGITHHVDHIVPLQSNLVCGLHWEGNLQLLTANENHRKKNVYWPDMPERKRA